MSETESLEAELPPSRSARVRAIVDDCLLRRAAGQAVSDRQLLDEHPELRSDLACELRRLRMIEAAGSAALDDRLKGGPQPNVTPGPESSDSSSLGIRCPHCHEYFKILGESSLELVDCPCCGGAFALIDDEPRGAWQSGASLGPFVLLERLGEGGFGTVWKARDTRLDRLVAVKIPHASRMSRVDGELFFREARTAAQLRHPLIVAVHEVGRVGDTIFIVTDLVEGQPLSRWMLRNRLSSREAAEMARQITAALDHAHRAGVVHRDLKPANVLIDVDGQPRLTDFGLARREADDVTLTISGQVLGTPAYMSPEQASGGSHLADARSDIYSLGVLLFELLTGELPFRGSVRAILDAVMQHEPPRPRRMNRHIPKDLETICLKCLEKAPTRRYESAAALGDDLQRFLQGVPIHARSIGPPERLWRWMRRNPLPAALASLVVALAIVGPLVAVQQGRLATRERKAREDLLIADEALQHNVYVARINMLQRAAETDDFARAEELLATLVPQPGQPDLRGFEWYYWRSVCRRGLEQVIPAANRMYSVAVAPDERLLAFGGYDYEVTLWDLAKREVVHKLAKPHTNAIKALDFSRDGTRLASGDNDDRICLWDTASGELLHELIGHRDEVRAVCFTPDDRTLLSASLDGRLLEWDVATGTLSHEWPTGVGALCDAAISADGELVAISGGVPHSRKQTGLVTECTIVVFDYASRAERLRIRDGEMEPVGLSFSSDGTRLAVGGTKGRPLAFDMATGQPAVVLANQAHSITSTAFSRDGSTLFGAGKRGLLWAWDMSNGGVRERLSGHSDVCLGMAPFPRTGRIATCGFDRMVRIWDLTGAPLQQHFAGHEKAVGVLQASADGRTWLVGGMGTLRGTRFDFEAKSTQWIRAAEFEQRVAALHPSDKSVIVKENEQLLVLPPGKSKAVHFYDCDPNWSVSNAIFSPDGNRLAAAFWTGDAAEIPGQRCRIIVWDWATRTIARQFVANRRGISHLAFSPDGRSLATAGYDRTVIVFDVDTGIRRREFDLSAEIAMPVMGLAFSPDNRTLAAGATGWIWVWDALSLARLHRAATSGGSHYFLAFSPDGRTLAVAQGPAASDRQVPIVVGAGVIALWDTSTWEVKTVLPMADSPSRVAFSPDGKQLVAGSHSGNLTVWQAQ